MQMEAGLDTGPVLMRRALSIGPEETMAELHDRLSALGSAAIIIVDFADSFLRRRNASSTLPRASCLSLCRVTEKRAVSGAAGFEGAVGVIAR